jgi:hypothetical protein
MVLSFAATNIQLGILDHSLGGPFCLAACI